jgi:hypothetical protein
LVLVRSWKRATSYAEKHLAKKEVKAGEEEGYGISTPSHGVCKV